MKIKIKLINLMKRLKLNKKPFHNNRLHLHSKLNNIISNNKIIILSMKYNPNNNNLSSQYKKYKNKVTNNKRQDQGKKKLN